MIQCIFGLDLGQQSDPTAMVGFRPEPLPPLPGVLIGSIGEAGAVEILPGLYQVTHPDLDLGIAPSDCDFRPNSFTLIHKTEKGWRASDAFETIPRIRKPGHAVVQGPKGLEFRSPSKPRFRHDCVALGRWELHTQYTEIVEDLRKGCEKPGSPMHGCVLAVDQTGVGRPVVELLFQAKLACEIVPITITGGTSPIRVGPSKENPKEFWGWHVPKKDLVAALQVPMQDGLLAVDPDAFPLSRQFGEELQNFVMKKTKKGNDQFEAWRETAHDDIVLAAGVGLWTHQNGQKRKFAAAWR